ncbi:hypothetical protein B0H11DRAFT_1927864 [Mycena galericulata]|nr:hypothetical protein B0H11DRAFT_1927864 [Mycena galericulata]
MDLRLPPVEVPARRAPDPIITPLHICSNCPSPLGDLRVHEGTSDPAARGRIVQTCKGCYKSHHHTPAYIHDDAKHLLICNTCRQLRYAIPHASTIAPLRFAPPPLDPLPQGPFPCTAPGCLNRSGVPRQGAHKCIEHKCKNCCLEAADSAATLGTYRDICKTHGTTLVDGYTPPVQPPPQSSAPLRRLPPVQPPGQHAALAHFPAQPHAGPRQTPGRGGGSRGLPRGGASRGRGRSLAQPMSNKWAAKIHTAGVEQTHPDTGKVARQKLDVLANHTAELAIYHSKGQLPLCLHLQSPSFPQMRLSDHQALMNDLGLTEASWMDILVHSAWQTMLVSATFPVDKNHPTLIRLRPSLLVELGLADCPDINIFTEKQPRKRTEIGAHGHSLDCSGCTIIRKKSHGYVPPDSPDTCDSQVDKSPLYGTA